MKNWMILGLLLLGLFGCKSTKEASKAAEDDPYLIMVSIDGFRFDYETLHGAPNLKALAAEGVKTESMIPSYPASTFPNHYTLVTGLYPENHGLVSNRFYDPARGESYRNNKKANVQDSSWYGGKPLWVLAEQQGVTAASYFWVGSEMGIEGVYPTYYHEYDGSIPNDDRVTEIIRWLNLPEDERPRLLFLYFSLVDDAGHEYGPEQAGTAEAVQEADRLVGSLWSQVKEIDLPVNIIVTSDHGMQQTDNQNPIYLDKLTDLEGFQMEESSSTITMLYKTEEKGQEDLEKAYQDLTAAGEGRFHTFWRNEVPDSLHFSSNPRCGDILIQALAPNVFGGHYGRLPSPGCHGYDPYQCEDMGAIFYAWGPAFKSGEVLPPFENIHLYPLAAKVLGLSYKPSSIDGKLEILAPALK